MFNITKLQIRVITVLLFVLGFSYGQNYIKVDTVDKQFKEGNTSDVKNRILRINVSMTKSETISPPFDITVKSISKSAMAGSDFLPLNNRLTLGDSNASTQVAITVLKDDDYEHDEYLELIFISNNPTRQFENKSTIYTLVVDISNDDNPPSTSVEEGDVGLTGMFFVLQRDAEDTRVEVTVKTEDGSALLSDNDYEYKSVNIFFDPYETVKFVKVNIVGDTKYEVLESFSLTITFSDAPGKVKILNPIGQILETSDPIPTVKPERTSYAIAESGTIDIVFRLSNPSVFEESFIINTTANTAIEHTDYKAIDEKIVFSPGTTEARYTLKVIDDTIDEITNETFSIIMTNSTNGLNIEPTSHKILISIIDNDSPPLPPTPPPGLITIFIDNLANTSGNFYVGELDIGKKVIINTARLSVPTTKVITVVVFTTAPFLGLVATPFVDYNSFVQTLTFNPGEDRKRFNIEIINDTEKEKTEYFNLKVISGSTDYTSIIPNRGNLAIAIVDDDDVALSYKTNTGLFSPALNLATVKESDITNSPFTITFTLNKPHLKTTTIFIENLPLGSNPLNNNAEHGKDFIMTSTIIYKIEIPPGKVSTNYIFDIVSDYIFEKDEYFDVIIHTPAGNVLFSQPNTLTVKIQDEDFDFKFYISSYSNDINKYINNAISTFPEGQTTETTVGILITRGNETDTSASVQFTTTVWVTWDWLRYGVTPYSRADLLHKNNVALISDNDFDLHSNNQTKFVIFAPGEKSKILSFTIKPDIKPEENEQLPIFFYYPRENLKNNYFPTTDFRLTGIDLVHQSTRVNIIDDDAFLDIAIEFNSTNYIFDPDTRKLSIEINEGNKTDYATKTFYLKFFNTVNNAPFTGLNFASSIEMIKNDAESTIDDNDLRNNVPESIKLDFTPGDFSKPFLFPIELDDILERDEKIVYKIITKGFKLPYSDYIFEFILKNDDSPYLEKIEIGNTTTRILKIKEGDIKQGNSTTVTLHFKNTGIPVDIQISTKDKVAQILDKDYVQIQQDLTVASNPSSITFTVSSIGDTKYEADEEFEIEIKNKYFDYTILATILNDDIILPELVYSYNFVSAFEGNSNILNKLNYFEITFAFKGLSSVPGLDVEVDFEIIDLQAFILEDYFLNHKTNTLTIPANTLNSSIRIPIWGDTVYESNENFLFKISNVKNARLTSPKILTLTIKNDDALPASEVTEGPSIFHSFVVVKSDEDLFPTKAFLSTKDNSTSGNDDYVVLKSYEVVFKPYETVKIINVPIVDDNLYELDEYFELIVEGNTSSHSVNVLNGRIIIRDNEPITELRIAFIKTDDEGNPGNRGGQVEFVINLSNPTQYPLTFNLTSTDITAISGIDYVFLDEKIILSSGETQRKFHINSIPDIFVEPTESMSIHIFKIDPNIIIPISLTATGFIPDDDYFPLPPSIDDNRIFTNQDIISGSVNQPFQSTVTAYIVNSSGKTVSTFSTQTDESSNFILKVPNPQLVLSDVKLYFDATNIVGRSEYTLPFVPQNVIYDIADKIFYGEQKITKSISFIEGDKPKQTQYYLRLKPPSGLFTNSTFKYILKDGDTKYPAKLSDNDFIPTKDSGIIYFDKEFSILTITIQGDGYNEADETFVIEMYDFKYVNIVANSLNSFILPVIILNDDSVHDVRAENWRLSPNEDGQGAEYLKFENIERYPQNDLTIYDRWGNIVYIAKNYDNINIKFEGKNYANKEIFEGVYYYVLNLNKIVFIQNDRQERKDTLFGFIHIKR